MRSGAHAVPYLACLFLFALSPRSAHGQEEMTFGAMEVGETIPAADLMESGIQKYDSKDFAGASMDFFSVVQAEEDVEADKYRQKAEYMLGRALYQLGYYQSALNYFNRVVDAGADHKYFRATNKMLYLLLKRLGDPQIVERIATYSSEDYDARFRDDLLFIVGKHHYDRGNLDQGLTELKAIARDSKHYAKAKFLEGILFVRKNEAQPAVEAFKEILRVVAEDPGAVKSPFLYQRLAWLSLARIFYSTGQYELAAKYYDKVPVESREWLQALFESSWTFFQLDNFGKALGNLHTLDSPFFADEYFPESYLLRAVVYFTTCNYKEVRDTIDRFMAIFSDLKERLDGHLAKHEEPGEFWVFLVSLNQEGGEYGARTRQIFKAAFSDRALSRVHRYIGKVEAELTALTDAQGPWGESELKATLVQEVEVVRSLAVHEAGTMAKQRLERVVNDLGELISQARKIKFETANAEIGQLENRLRDEQYAGGGGQGGGAGVALDEEHVYWPFAGEYWKDELGSYVYLVKPRCGR